MIRPLGRLGAAATLGQQCPQMTQRRCISLILLWETVPHLKDSRTTFVFKGRPLLIRVRALAKGAELAGEYYTWIS